MNKKTLAVIQFNSVGAGYTALNQAGAESSLEVLEFSPLGEFSQILILGPHDEILVLINEIRSGDIARSICLQDFDESILRSYLSLDNAAPEQAAIIIESNFLGDLLEAAVALTQINLQILDFRLFRTTNSPGYLLMTGIEVDTAAQWIEKKNARLAYPFLKYKTISELSPGFKNFF